MRQTMYGTKEVCDKPIVAETTMQRQVIFEQLMIGRVDNQNDFYLARILSSWIMGDGVLPGNLGLKNEDYCELVRRHFPLQLFPLGVSNKGELELERIPEWEDLVGLLLEFRAGADQSEIWLAEIIAAACMGQDHLWQDLGLWSRGELTELITINYPTLGERNNKDMKWKKFLYKQLCERDGTYVCRAPSCEVCVDYNVCFGPEE